MAWPGLRRVMRMHHVGEGQRHGNVYASLLYSATHTLTYTQGPGRKRAGNTFKLKPYRASLLGCLIVLPTYVSCVAG